MHELLKRFIPSAIILAGLTVTNLQSRPEFPAQWRAVYPDSAAGERECQICHVGVDGFEPWNTYGFEIRTNYLDIYGSEDIKAAIISVENNNSDNDPQDLSNLEEIQRDLDPGWTPGSTNSWVFENGDAFVDQLPPNFVRPVDTPPNNSLCLPIATSDNVLVICL